MTASKNRTFSAEVEMVLSCDQPDVVYNDVHRLVAEVAPGMLTSRCSPSSIVLGFSFGLPADRTLSQWQSSVERLGDQVRRTCSTVTAQYGCSGELAVGGTRVLFETC